MKVQQFVCFMFAVVVVCVLQAIEKLLFNS